MINIIPHHVSLFKIYAILGLYVFLLYYIKNTPKGIHLFINIFSMLLLYLSFPMEGQDHFFQSGRMLQPAGK